MEKGGDLPINRGFGASQEKWSNLRSIIIPTPLPLREKSQKRGKAALYTGVKFAPVGGWEVGLWESLGLLPLTWFDPHGPRCQGGIFSGNQINLAPESNHGKPYHGGVCP